MKRTPILSFVLAAATLTSYSSSAHAWSEDTHEEIARQSILYMLRSSNPTLRFVGTILMSGGEGGKASPTGERSWQLSEEAKNVDFYNDVVLKNTANTPGSLGEGDDGNLFHEFMGNNFTAYNHFLLYEDGGKDTSAWSYDHYSTSCGDLYYKEGQGMLRRRRDIETSQERWYRLQQEQDCFRSCDPLGQAGNTRPDGLPHSDLRVQIAGVSQPLLCSSVYPRGSSRIWMDMHDNYGGYSVAIDSSLDGEVGEDGFPTRGQLLRMVGTHSELQDFCGQALSDAIDIDLSYSDIPFIGGIVDFALGNIPYADTLEDAASYLLRETLVAAANKWLAPMCPSIEGYWPEGAEYLTSHGIDNYTNNHSSMLRSDYDKISMVDIRWHPVDNLVAYGADIFVEKLQEIPPIPVSPPSAPPTFDPCLSPDPLVGCPGGSPKPTSSPTGNVNQQSSASNWVAASADTTTPSRPSHIGNLKNLGRVMHGMSDLAVPGHITGHLLGNEHLFMEGGANDFVQLFDTYLTEAEQTSDTGAIQNIPHGSGATIFALDGLIDVDEASETILDIVTASDFDSFPIEEYAERAAQTTLEEFRLDTTAGRFAINPSNGESLISPSLRRQYLTRALVNNVVGAVHSMKSYYARHATTSWEDIVADISWTEEDANLVSQPGQSQFYDFPSPGFYSVVVAGGGANYNLNVDHNYQEFEQSAGCYVETHDWCLPVSTDGFHPLSWQPCRSDCTDGNCYDCVGEDCHNRGPSFVTGLSMGARVTLSSANRGRVGDEIHVTGLYDQGETDLEHFRGSLSDSAGQPIILPAGTVETGFAVWCTGPDIGREIFEDDSGQAVTDVSCEIEEIAPLNALPCTSNERQIWTGYNAPVTETSYDSGQAGANTLPAIPVGPEQNYIDTATLEQLAISYETSKDGLAKALSSAHGKVVKVLDPSPWGRASFVWVDEKGLSNITTVTSSGSIMTKRSTEPVLLQSKTGR